MYKSKVLVGFVLLFYALSVVFQFSDNELFARNCRALILPIITLIYFLYIKEKTLYFTLFLIFYSISDLMILVEGYISGDLNYYLGNILYIIAYMFLLLKIVKSVSIQHVIKNFKVHLVVLTALNVYIVYVLQVIVSPYMEANEYYVDLIYNIVMLLVLSAALINYFYRDNKKSLYLFIGSLAIVFSEVIGVAYIYISAKNFLSFLSMTLAILAFYFFYQQAKLENEEVKSILLEE